MRALQTSRTLLGKMSMLSAASTRTALATRQTASRCCGVAAGCAVLLASSTDALPFACCCARAATQIMPLQPRMMVTPVHATHNMYIAIFKPL
jgi:hypothetical protein